MTLKSSKDSKHLLDVKYHLCNGGRPMKIYFLEFPLLQKKVLAIPASSTPVERLFSTVGNVFTNKRQQLKATTAKCQVLLHENKHL